MLQGTKEKRAFNFVTKKLIVTKQQKKVKPEVKQQAANAAQQHWNGVSQAVQAQAYYQTNAQAQAQAQAYAYANANADTFDPIEWEGFLSKLPA
jgi:hypothetical protein